MKTKSTSAMQPNWPSAGSCEDLRQHWYEPLLPHERRQPCAAIAAEMKRLCLRLGVIGRLVATGFAIWAKRARSRRELAQLDEYALSDIGLTRADILREMSKPFWRGYPVASSADLQPTNRRVS